ncbi:hypothetical protein A6A27_25490 [Micromonospora sp. CB01531]|nr:hypothetical protein A6A27_25490 [Micromonospora sp. CB01531]
MQSGGTEALRLAANIVEHASAEHPELGAHLSHGLQILAPTLIGRSPGAEIDIATLVSDLEFASRYHHLRDLFYYTYNAPGTVSWTFDAGRIEIRFADASLPRQFFISSNSWFVESMEAFSDKTRAEKTKELLRGQPEFELTPEVLEAAELIEAEVQQKVRLYFDLISDSTVTVGEYTYRDFVAVYRALLAKALYHRYHSDANGARGALSMPLDILVSDLEASAPSVPAATARQVVTDIAYGSTARRKRLNPVYFSLYHLPETDEILMLPHHFAVWEGYISFLRLVALRDPQVFLRSFSGQIGESLVRRLGNSFEGAGFRVRTNTPLATYSAELPDIDLLVISEERTLGYAVLACEVKAPLPPSWAKDQLRVLEPDSIAKSFGQVERITAFLGSDEGVDFLCNQLPRAGIPDFDEFAMLIWTVVATSDNAGAFFADRGTIIDYRTLERILRRCDGDMLYVLTALKEFPNWADSCFERAMDYVRVGDLDVSYEGITIKRLMEFPQNEFRSVDVAEMMVRGMLEEGHRPLDVFRERGVDFEDGREAVAFGEDGDGTR